MTYLAWFDDSKASASAKIAAALEAYERRYGYAANEVLVNEADQAVVAAVKVEARSYMRRHTFYVGRREVEGCPAKEEKTELDRIREALEGSLGWTYEHDELSVVRDALAALDALGQRLARYEAALPATLAPIVECS